ncbi:hypothetical protein EV127DRAFT_17366 [Xylaria flabelliformis]|nr:hypothetical protein EV127DRAFT_17366 [Xylaria flabelliformis]
MHCVVRGLIFPFFGLFPLALYGVSKRQNAPGSPIHTRVLTRRLSFFLFFPRSVETETLVLDLNPTRPERREHRPPLMLVYSAMSPISRPIAILCGSPLPFLSVTAYTVASIK